MAASGSLFLRAIAAVLLAATAVAIVVSVFQPDAALSEFQWGLLQIVYTYEEALPLLAIGTALAGVPRTTRILTGILVAGAYLAGQFILSSYLDLFGPVTMLLGGTALILPARPNAYALPILAALASLLISTVTNFNAQEATLAMGAAVASAWLILLAFAIATIVPQGVIRVARPIAGSWLTVIGFLLLTFYLLPDPGSTPTAGETPEMPETGP